MGTVEGQLTAPFASKTRTTSFPLIAFPVSPFTTTKLIVGTRLSFVVSSPTTLTPFFTSFSEVKCPSNLFTSVCSCFVIAANVAFSLVCVSGSEKIEPGSFSDARRGRTGDRGDGEEILEHAGDTVGKLTTGTTGHEFGGCLVNRRREEVVGEGGQIGELGETSIESGDVRTIHLPAAVEYCKSLCQCIIDVPWRSQSQHSRHPSLVRRPFYEEHMPHNQQRSRVSWRLSRQLSRESIFPCQSFLP